MLVFSGRIRWLHKSTHEEGWSVSKVCIWLWAFDVLPGNWTAAGNFFLIVLKDFSFTYTHLNEGTSVAITIFSLLLTDEAVHCDFCRCLIELVFLLLLCLSSAGPFFNTLKFHRAPKLPTEFNFNFLLIEKVWSDSCQEQGIVVCWQCPDWLWGTVGSEWILFWWEGVKQVWCEGDRASLSAVKIKYEWRYTSTVLYALITDLFLMFLYF